MKKQYFYITGLIVASVLLLVACTKPTTVQKEEVQMTQKQKEELKKQQEALALFLVNNYEDIRKIEFSNITKGGFGRTDSAELIINDATQLNIELQDSYEIGNTLGSFKAGEDMPVLKKEASNISRLSDADCIVYFFDGGTE